MGGGSSNFRYAVEHKKDGSNCSPIYRSPRSPDKLLESRYPDCKTVRDYIKRSFKLYANNKCLGTSSLIQEKSLSIEMTKTKKQEQWLTSLTTKPTKEHNMSAAHWSITNFVHRLKIWAWWKAEEWILWESMPKIEQSGPWLTWAASCMESLLSHSTILWEFKIWPIVWNKPTWLLVSVPKKLSRT